VRASSCQPTFTDKTLSFAFLSFARSVLKIQIWLSAQNLDP
jgi:hypothetical protein